MNRFGKNILFTLCCLCISAFVTSLFAATYLVGPTRTYKVPSAVSTIVKTRDTVLIDAGTYEADVAAWAADSLTLKGVGKYAHLKGCGSRCKMDKAIWVVQGNNTVIENIEFSDAAISDDPGANGAGIRQEGNNVTIRNCFFHDCQNGILGGGGSTSNMVIENTEFARCGLDPCPVDGCVHNMYIGPIASFTLKFCYSHSAKIGHLVKSRARLNYVLYNRLTNESDGTASYELSFPDGGNAYVVGNIIEQCPATDNPAIIDYASESYRWADAKSLYVVNNTVVNHRSGGTFVQFASGTTTVRILNNLFIGPGAMLSRPADTAKNIQTTAPAFVNETGFDYRPTSASPGINQGIDPGSAGGFSLVPVFQYVHPMSGQPRAIAGSAIDIGAYEYAAGATAVPRQKNRYTRTAGSGAAEYFTIDGRRIDRAKRYEGKSSGTPVLIIKSGKPGIYLR